MPRRWRSNRKRWPGKGKEPLQQLEDLISRTSSVTDLLCDTGQGPSLSGSQFPLLYKEGIGLDAL